MNEMFSQGGKGSTGILTNKQAIARKFGVKQNEVVYFSVGVDLGGYKVIYDKSTQRAYSLPVLPVGTTAVSLNEHAVLVHSAGSVDLGELAAERNEYVTLPGSFTSGSTVNTRNELLTHNGLQYSWGGELPKVVPASSTPDSTGGIGFGLWVIGGYDLSKGKQINVSDFGVSGSGDETEKLRAAHAKANELGIPVVYDVKEVTVAGKADIEVRTSVDFNNCMIKPIASDALSYDTTPVYRLVGNPLVDVTASVIKTQYTKGVMSLPCLSAYSRKTLIVSSSQYFCYRSSLGASSGTPSGTEYKTSINRIDKYGSLEYPLEHGFTSDAYVSSRVRDDEDFVMTMRGLTIDLSNYQTGCFFKVERSQVHFEKHILRDYANTKVTNIRQLYYLGECVSQIVFRDIYGEANSSFGSTEGTYVFTGRGACDILFDNVHSLQGWGSIAFNVVQGVNVVNSTVNRFDVHYHGYNIYVDNCRLSEFGITMGCGGGDLIVTNCNRNIGSLNDFYQYSSANPLVYMLSVIYFRGDYGNYFDGNIVVDGVKMELSRDNIFSTATESAPGVLSVVSFNAGKARGSSVADSYADYGYTAPVPWGNSITVKNVTLHLHNAAQRASWVSLVGVNYGKRWVAPSVLPAPVITVENLNFDHAPSTAKIEPIVFTDMVHSTSLVKSNNKRVNFNLNAQIRDVHSGWVSGRATMIGTIGSCTLDLMYSQTEVSSFPENSVVPRIVLDNVTGIAARASIPCQVDVDGGLLLGMSDSSEGRNQDCWITFRGTKIFCLPNTSGGTTSNLPRASWDGCRFINSGIQPDVTIMDSMKGCTFENGVTPIGIASASAGFTGVVGDSGDRLQ